jgi:phosphatidylglycerol---prolipoprotein diacylglyceryl transferase
MRPQLFSLLEIGFPAYFVLLISGFIFATVIGALWARRVGEDPDVMIDLGLAMLLAGVVGSRILHVLADGYFWDYVHLCTDPSLVDWKVTAAECASPRMEGVWDAVKGVCHPPDPGLTGRIFDQNFRYCFSWAAFWAGGLTYYGGFLGAGAAAFYLLKRDRFPFWKAADMAGMVIPIGLTFGRMGCLLAGCCFGVQTDHAAGLVFPANSPASEWQFKAGLLPTKAMLSMPVHPTQIYESAASLAIAAFCMLWMHPRKRYDGQVFFAFVSLYAIARFLLEIWRSDDRGGVVGLSTSQLIGLGLLAGAALLHRYRSRGLLPLDPEPVAASLRASIACPSGPPQTGPVATWVL